MILHPEFLLFTFNILILYLWLSIDIVYDTHIDCLTILLFLTLIYILKNLKWNQNSVGEALHLKLAHM